MGLLQACAAGGSDDSFWAPGGTPPPGGVGGAGSSTTSPSSSTTGPGSSTTGPSSSSTTGPSSSSTTGPSSSTTGPGSSSTAASSSTSTSSGAVSWTDDIYNPIFGPSGTSPCSVNGSCHTHSQSGLTCGTDQTTCYNGFVSYGMVVPGSGATSQSTIVNPATSPLCGTLGGNMPRSGYACITDAQITTITNWLAAGAPDN
jgi:hypothetical protein